MSESASRLFIANRPLCLILLAIFCMTATAPTRAADPAASDDKILDYVDRTIKWYRAATGIDQATADPQEVIFRNAVHQNSLQVVHLSFDFGKAQAALLATEKGPTTAPANSQAARLAQAIIDANARVARIQSELDVTTQEIAKSQSRPPEELTAKRDKLVAELNLAKTRREVIQNFAGFNGAAGGLRKESRNSKSRRPKRKATRNPPPRRKSPLQYKENDRNQWASSD